MSHTPLRNDGSAFKRKLNLKRPFPGPVGPVDPLFSDVILLLPMSGVGDTFTDLSPLANVMTLNGADAVFEMDGIQPLFGENTLDVIHTAGQSNKYLSCVQLANAMSDATNVCIEYWFNQTISSLFTSSPLHMRFVPTTAGVPVGVGLLQSVTSAPGLPIKFRNALTSGADVPFSNGDWHYVAYQYRGSDTRMYCYLDGVLQYSILSGIGLSLGWNFFLGDITAGVSANAYRIWFANVRITRALRYDALANIPIPTAPWPAQ